VGRFTENYARSALAIANAMAYDRHISDLEAIVAGRSGYRQLLKQIRNPPEIDDRIASESEESDVLTV
jgi:hypothetical protein